MTEHRFTVPAGAAGERLDRFLAARLPELSRSRVGALVRESMEQVMPLKVPLRVDVGSGRNWAEAH